ncbi:DNA polymerase III subunit chi [Alteromonas facilis]|uniref:DNA polymerase III subunit chi n=1 Tax=Alteromonas facilis TaxID=2048004 RepID=UPI000C28F3B7|nr:DNA polymerase III subunit chi [Alteromonas facilis]
MNVSATFYQLDSDDLFEAVTPLVVECYRARQPLVLICKDKASAEAWDEHLWRQPNDAFIPHNLRGEGPANGTPVTITWPPVSETKAVAINLAGDVLPLQRPLKQVIDFVPTDDSGKQAARERYKQYQQAGCTMQFKQFSKEINNG